MITRVICCHVHCLVDFLKLIVLIYNRSRAVQLLLFFFASSFLFILALAMWTETRSSGNNDDKWKNMKNRKEWTNCNMKWIITIRKLRRNQTVLDCANNRHLDHVKLWTADEEWKKKKETRKKQIDAEKLYIVHHHHRTNHKIMIIIIIRSRVRSLHFAIVRRPRQSVSMNREKKPKKQQQTFSIALFARVLIEPSQETNNSHFKVCHFSDDSCRFNFSVCLKFYFFHSYYTSISFSISYFFLYVVVDIVVGDSP